MKDHLLIVGLFLLAILLSAGSVIISSMKAGMSVGLCIISGSIVLAIILLSRSEKK